MILFSNKHILNSIYLSVEISIAACICFVIGFDLSTELHRGQSIIGGFWCLITATTILQSSIKDSYSASYQIFIGSLIGGAVAFVLTSLLSYHYYVMLLAVVISVLLTMLFHLESAIKMSSVNAGVIVALGIYQPSYSPLLNSSLRLMEMFSGTLIALIFICISRVFKVRNDSKADND